MFKQEGVNKVEAREKIKNFFQSKIKYLIYIFLLIFVLSFINPFVIIGAGERGVVLNFGAVQDTVMGEGIHLRIPIMQRVVRIDVRLQKSQTDAAAASRDLQETHSTIALNYHILPEKANWVYQKIGHSYKERIIDPAVRKWSRPSPPNLQRSC